MIRLHNALAREVTTASAPRLRMIIVRPPRLSMLPRRRLRPGTLVASVFLHAAAMASLVWLPPLFAQPVLVAREHFSKSEPVILDEPLVLPALPHVEERSSAAKGSRSATPPSTPAATAPHVNAPPRTPDYTAPQTIVSDVASPVNRVQTILRPDLVAPPSLKFPLRLQTAVMFPATPIPVLAPQPPEPPAETAPVASPEEAPAIKPTVPTPVLALTSKRGSLIRAKAAPAQNVSPNLKTFAGPNTNAIKALIVVNAVQVAPDPSTAVPDGQLAGRFVVGPSTGAPGGGNSSPSSTASTASTRTGRGPSSEDSHSPATGRGNEPNVSGNGAGGMAGSTRPGSGGGTGAANGSGSSGAGTGKVSSGAPGISISGGIPGHNRATASAFPGRPSYPLMIISGGASGGASRDLGVFTRSETVYSVSIPMADAGGGPDWTMQYALRDPAQAGAGLLVPPMAQKKVVAAVKSSAISVDSGPVFISGIIDENGKLQSLRPVRVQDTRSQPAIRALEQWEFLPAQLDGKVVATKVLLGVAVRVEE